MVQPVTERSEAMTRTARRLSFIRVEIKQMETVALLYVCKGVLAKEIGNPIRRFRAPHQATAIQPLQSSVAQASARGSEQSRPFAPQSGLY
jgi:hypothetical protein